MYFLQICEVCGCSFMSTVCGGCVKFPSLHLVNFFLYTLLFSFKIYYNKFQLTFPDNFSCELFPVTAWQLLELFWFFRRNIYLELVLLYEVTARIKIIISPTLSFSIDLCRFNYVCGKCFHMNVSFICR